MATETNSKQVLLNVKQITSIRSNHPPTADAIVAIVNYINKNVIPIQGNRVQPK